MRKLPILKKGDQVELIAPASRFKSEHLENIKALLTGWGFRVAVAEKILGDDLLCANNDNARAQSLIQALQNKKNKAIICIRGGYGSLRLIPALAKIAVPNQAKIFIGMSDITALNLFLIQHWQWPVIHGGAAVDKCSPESIAHLKSLLFAERKSITFSGEPLNQHAVQDEIIQADMTGGNLSVIQTSIGTKWQLNGRNKIIFLEEIGERAYRIDRMLEHLRQSRLFQGAVAIVFGDFLEGNEPNGTSLIQPVIQRFADACKIPVLQIKGIGHGYVNFPLPLGTKAKLYLGEKPQLICSR